MLARLIRNSFCTILKDIPQVGLNNFLTTREATQDCHQVAEAFRKFGCIIIKDPRISEEKNATLVNMMKKYYMKRQQQVDRGQLPDVYKEYDYDIGLSPPGIIILDDYSYKLHQFTQENKPLTPFPPRPSRTMRYLWNVGDCQTQQENKPPKDFPEFQGILNDWGNHAFQLCLTLTEMLEIGLSLSKGSFSDKLKGGPNKLAPNGFDLTRCDPGEPFIGLHYDYTFLTIHGRSTYPGLYIWLSNGQKLKVRVPPGYLFIQAGSQLQYLTGGYIKSGLHEAINTEEVQQLSRKQMEAGGHPWRINSTVFTHIHPEVLMQPLGHFACKQALLTYPPVLQKDYMSKYLKKRQAN